MSVHHLYTFAITHSPIGHDNPGQKKVRVYLFESQHLLRILSEQGSKEKAIWTRSSHRRAFEALQAMGSLYAEHLKQRPPGAQVRDGPEGKYLDLGTLPSTTQYSALPDRLGQVGYR